MHSNYSKCSCAFQLFTKTGCTQQWLWNRRGREKKQAHYLPLSTTADSQQCCQVLCSGCAGKGLGFVFRVPCQGLSDQFIAMLGADVLQTTDNRKVSSCFASPIATRPLNAWELVWLNLLMTTTGWKKESLPPVLSQPCHQFINWMYQGTLLGGHTKRGQTWWSCWSRLGPWQKWSVWWFQSPRPQAPPQSKSWARTQEAHPHPPRWCEPWWCLGKDPGSGIAFPGGGWHPLLSTCSFSCSQSLEAKERKIKSSIRHTGHVI